MLLHQHGDEVRAVGAGGLDRGVGQLVREVHQVGDDRVVQRQVLGHDGGAGQLGRPGPGREPGQLEDQPVLRRQRSDRAAALPVPRLDLDGPGRDVEVDGDRGRGQQSDGAEQALLDDPVVGTPTSRPRRDSDAAGSCRRASASAYAACSTEPRLPPSRSSRPPPSSSPSRRSKGSGAPFARIAANRSSGRVRATRRGSPSSRSCGVGRAGRGRWSASAPRPDPGRRAG